MDSRVKKKCPKCGSEHIKNNGAREEFNYYKCQECGKTFKG
jgi:transposase-like protein